MSKRIVSIGLMVVILVSLILASACATELPKQEQVKYITDVGITALSGPAAVWGLAMDQVWHSTIDEINDAGGFTVNGQKYMWKYKSYDHAFDPAASLAAANRAVTEDNAIMLQILDTDCTKSVQPLTEGKKVIVFSYATPDKVLINPNNPHTFMYDIDAIASAVLFPHIDKNTDIKNIALFQPDNSLGDTTAQFANWSIKNFTKNLKIVYEGRADPSTSDFYASLTNILNSKPDLIDIDNWDPSGSSLIIKQSRELGYKGAFELLTPDIPTLKEVAGWQNCENTYLCPALVKENDRMVKFKDRYLKQWGEKYWQAALSYSNVDQLYWMTQAIVGAQSLDGDVIADYMAKMETSSIFGSPCNFGGVNYFGIARIPLHPYYIGLVKNGEVIQAVNGEIATALK